MLSARYQNIFDNPRAYKELHKGMNEVIELTHQYRGGTERNAGCGCNDFFKSHAQTSMTHAIAIAGEHAREVAFAALGTLVDMPRTYVMPVLGPDNMYEEPTIFGHVVNLFSMYVSKVFPHAANAAVSGGCCGDELTLADRIYQVLNRSMIAFVDVECGDPTGLEEVALHRSEHTRVKANIGADWADIVHQFFKLARCTSEQPLLVIPIHLEDWSVVRKARAELSTLSCDGVVCVLITPSIERNHLPANLAVDIVKGEPT